MEFLLYLSQEGRDIYNIISNKIRVIENAPICKKYDIYGWYDASNKKMIFCTSTIKKGENVAYYVNETLFHESVHLAQSCKNNMGNLYPFGISEKNIKLSSRRKNDLQKSVSISGNKIFKIEKEAYWMEDKPDKVKYVLQKYCF